MNTQSMMLNRIKSLAKVSRGWVFLLVLLVGVTSLARHHSSEDESQKFQFANCPGSSDFRVLWPDPFPFYLPNWPDPYPMEHEAQEDNLSVWIGDWWMIPLDSEDRMVRQVLTIQALPLLTADKNNRLEVILTDLTRSCTPTNSGKAFSYEGGYVAPLCANNEGQYLHFKEKMLPLGPWIFKVLAVSLVDYRQGHVLGNFRLVKVGTPGVVVYPPSCSYP